MIVFGILWFVVHTSAGKEATLAKINIDMFH
jgi:hypothetical protein